MKYKCAIAGLGPAGAGFLFNINKFIESSDTPFSLLAVEENHFIGDGRLGEYQISANSLGQAFLECIEESRFSGWNAIMNNSEPQKYLRRHTQLAPQLGNASGLIREATEELAKYLQSRGQLNLQRQCRLESIDIQKNGAFRLNWFDIVNNTRTSAYSDTVICNLGGQQKLDNITNSLLDAGIRQEYLELPLIGSDGLLRTSPEDFEKTLTPFLKNSNTITIVGASHSTFSLIDRLTAQLPEKISTINVISRSQIRMFFSSTDEAEAEGYCFNSIQDVCPLSGRVHRFGGLRYRAKQVADSIIATGKVDDRRPRVRLLSLNPQHIDMVNDSLGMSSAVLVCTGYEARLPLIRDSQGCEIELQSRSGLCTDEFGRPFKENGELIKGLYSFGLGSGLRPDLKLGGEPSFHGRMDGVWLYHFDVGQRVLGSVLDHLNISCQAEE